MTARRRRRRPSAPSSASGWPWLAKRRHLVRRPTPPGRSTLHGTVLDGDGAAGARRHGGDLSSREGFGRCLTDDDGRYRFVTVKPAPGDGGQAPHLDVSVFARGLLQRLVTRIYFPDEAAANDADPLLAVRHRTRPGGDAGRRPRRRRTALRHPPAGRRGDGVPCLVTLVRAHHHHRRAPGRHRATGRGCRPCSTPKPPWPGPRRPAGVIPQAAAGVHRRRLRRRPFRPGRIWAAPRGTAATPSSPSSRALRRRRPRRRPPVGALGRDQPGHPRHRGHARGPPQPGADRRRPRAPGRRLRGAGRAPSPHAHDGPHPAPAGPADHLGLQGGGVAGRGHSPPAASWTMPASGWPPSWAGPAGTLASLGPAGPEVLAGYARRLGLAEPPVAVAHRPPAGHPAGRAPSAPRRARRPRSPATWPC